MCGTLLHGKRVRQRPFGAMLQAVSVTLEPYSKPFCLPAAPHPARLRRATLSSFVERDLRRIVAPISQMCTCTEADNPDPYCP